jgi:hypothetical protein
VTALIAADPAVTSSVFKPEAIAWNVMAMQATKK